MKARLLGLWIYGNAESDRILTFVNPLNTLYL